MGVRCVQDETRLALSEALRAELSRLSSLALSEALRTELSSSSSGAPTTGVEDPAVALFMFKADLENDHILCELQGQCKR